MRGLLAWAVPAPPRTNGLWHEADGAFVWTSCEELHHQARITRRVLTDWGIGAGDRIIIVSTPRLELFAVDLAAAQLDARLDVIGPESSAERASDLIRSSEPQVVFCQYAEQAVIVDGLCAAKIVTFEDKTQFMSWSEVLLTPGFSGRENGAATPRSASGPETAAATRWCSRPGDIVVCTADTSAVAVRASVHAAVESGAAVAVSQAEQMQRLHRLFDPDGIIAPARLFDAAQDELATRAPRETRLPTVTRAGVLLVVPVLWMALALGNIASSTTRASLAMAVSCLVVSIAAVRERDARRLLVVVTAASALAFGLRRADLGPSAVAALEFFVVATITLRVLRRIMQWATSAVWRRGAGSAGVPSSPVARRGPGRISIALASRAVERAARYALGLRSCRWAILTGARPEGTDHRLRLLGSIEVLALDADAPVSAKARR